MKHQLPDRANARQLRIQAKELLSQLPAGSKLADAQFELAKSYGFESWPKLIEHVELPGLLQALKSAIERGEASKLDMLLQSEPSLRTKLNEPIFAFDAPAIVWASQLSTAQVTIPVLVRHGADPNLRSNWWAGGFSALDVVSEGAVQALLSAGAKFDVWSAARHGRVSELAAILDANPELINARGGDGQTPLHFAGTPEVANLLIERGANLEIKDVDHESTPAQTHLRRKDVLRTLLEAGAKPDIFIAVALDDVDLVRNVLASQPDALSCQVGKPPFVTTQSNGGHIYAYLVGNRVTPLQFAAQIDSRKVIDELWGKLDPEKRLIVALQTDDAALAKEILAEHPDLPRRLEAQGMTLADAAQHGNANLVRLALQAGFDPIAGGLDGGTALHLAAWYGYDEIVRLLLDRVPLEIADPTHGGTPLSWALHGANNCRNPRGDYVAVVTALLDAGADASAPGNKFGATMLDQAGDQKELRELVKRFL